MKRALLEAALIAAAAFWHAPRAHAQELSSGYFLDHFNYGYRINPAFVPEDDVNGICGILVDNITIASNSNIGLSSFLFPLNGKLVTGLHEGISAEQFLGGLNLENIGNAAANFNILTAGFRTDPGGFGTVEINARSNVYANIPKGLMEFLKTGGKSGSPNQFNIDNMNLRTTSVVELALGYSHKIGDHFSLGGRLKLLAGICDADMAVDKMVIDIPRKSSDTWNISGSGSMHIAAPVKIDTKMVKGVEVYDINSIRVDQMGISGFGAAADLGFGCTLDCGLQFDAAVRDLGMMFWERSINGLMDYISDFKNSELNAILNDISKVLNYNPIRKTETLKQFINARFMLGIKYRMPFYRNLAVGVVDTYKMGYYYYNDLRCGLTITPIKQISLTANYGYTTYGHTMGVAANFNLGFAELFLGTDGLIFNVTPQYVPIDRLNTTINMGILVQFKKANS